MNNREGIVHYVTDFREETDSWRTKKNQPPVQVARTLCGHEITYAWETSQPRRPCVACRGSKKKGDSLLVVTLAGPIEVVGQLWSVTGDDSRDVPECPEETGQGSLLS